ncbi:bifunctional UDP-N-acetylglucosamine diphosphorylase/glucosamine-1-phosphate N-acetyltransferase GlmU [Fructilactobacillus sanfranciscensis]|uniref:bifunctional UDP-N-acetylglucosamine diphosphorylase/glucosamine-1-phosphate N-acetyltransferase GlmU n=1 Tax=Fructilactobacillus sanfranciscensis TaxID=1625 RepID=UPI0006EF1834|nr:bifunctional UDP-N-acetylglucosamine diphosphorylase/glucosamine-1-phosphate N-acetyltransferase GlmU [Fructilactobacillus sanfranciscensis]KRM80563.1 Bifunctional protein glmU [Fructilactobacillus sanfranciscensis DSM 20451]MCG7196031.1 bifunctional UDP-N-acetylglucosamine diphosphorylase/glucosamine-1-phosphate N-acetyltransferase GlmU [Fructilactobacillus sanfranciscensis]MVF15461.1 bifunctional UDP-N-acetylglucosamine diphosphorylase/glucosamine-1-phosphate N-acetyltransferase GlmU [Fruct
MSARNTIILAAGKGTRMKSKLYKVLHRICGKSMVDHVLTQVSKLNMDNIVTVVGFGAEDVEKELGNRTKYVVQNQQLGTGDAVLRAEDLLKNSDGTTLVISGDTPLFTAKTLEKLFAYHADKQATATILTSVAPNPTGYGRIVRNDLGIVEKIVEEKDASSEERNIKEINTGVYVFNNQKLFKALHEINNDNAQGEYYLTDAIEILKRKGGIIAAYQMDDFDESMGVNNRVAQAAATKVMQRRINEYHMNNGVTIVNPDDTYIDVDIEIGPDTIIEPGVQLQKGTKIGRDCVIGANSKITGSIIHDGVTVTSSTIEDSEMMDESNIGPNSHLRPQSLIGKHVHIGNFCEVKKATIGEGTKIGHLTYVGNATLGKDINVGCGVIFANYDGKNKHETKVGDDVFIGSNANLIAPLEIADHSFIAAGSTITDDIHQYDMAIARERQTNKQNYYQKLPFNGAD